jgi:hypothetical protein
MARKRKATDEIEISVVEGESATGSSLSGWGSIIQSMGEAERVRGEEELAAMRALLPERLAAVPGMSAVELLDTAIEMNRRSGNTWLPRQSGIYAEYYAACRKELLARMGHTGE